MGCLDSAQEQFDRGEAWMLQTAVGKFCSMLLMAFLFFCCIIAPVLFAVTALPKYEDYVEEEKYHVADECYGITKALLGEFGRLGLKDECTLFACYA